MNDKTLESLYKKLGLEANNVSFEDFKGALEEYPEYRDNIFTALVDAKEYTQEERGAFDDLLKKKEETSELVGNQAPTTTTLATDQSAQEAVSASSDLESSQEPQNPQDVIQDEQEVVQAQDDTELQIQQENTQENTPPPVMANATVDQPEITSATPIIENQTDMTPPAEMPDEFAPINADDLMTSKSETGLYPQTQVGFEAGNEEDGNLANKKMDYTFYQIPVSEMEPDQASRVVNYMQENGLTELEARIKNPDIFINQKQLDALEQEREETNEFLEEGVGNIINTIGDDIYNDGLEVTEGENIPSDWSTELYTAPNGSTYDNKLEFINSPEGRQLIMEEKTSIAGGDIMNFDINRHILEDAFVFSGADPEQFGYYKNEDGEWGGPRRMFDYRGLTQESSGPGLQNVFDWGSFINPETNKPYDLTKVKSYDDLSVLWDKMSLHMNDDQAQRIMQEAYNQSINSVNNKIYDYGQNYLDRADQGVSRSYKQLRNAQYDLNLIVNNLAYYEGLDDKMKFAYDSKYTEATGLSYGAYLAQQWDFQQANVETALLEYEQQRSSWYSDETELIDLKTGKLINYADADQETLDYHQNIDESALKLVRRKGNNQGFLDEHLRRSYYNLMAISSTMPDNFAEAWWEGNSYFDVAQGALLEGMVGLSAEANKLFFDDEEMYNNIKEIGNSFSKWGGTDKQTLINSSMYDKNEAPELRDMRMKKLWYLDGNSPWINTFNEALYDFQSANRAVVLNEDYIQKAKLNPENKFNMYTRDLFMSFDYPDTPGTPDDPMSFGKYGPKEAANHWSQVLQQNGVQISDEDMAFMEQTFAEKGIHMSAQMTNFLYKFALTRGMFKGVVGTTGATAAAPQGVYRWDAVTAGLAGLGQSKAYQQSVFLLSSMLQEGLIMEAYQEGFEGGEGMGFLEGAALAGGSGAMNMAWKAINKIPFMAKMPATMEKFLNSQSQVVGGMGGMYTSELVHELGHNKEWGEIVNNVFAGPDNSPGEKALLLYFMTAGIQYSKTGKEDITQFRDAIKKDIQNIYNRSYKRVPASIAANYKKLGIRPDATDQEVVDAYLKASEKYEDKGGYRDPNKMEEFMELHEAYTTVKNHRGQKSNIEQGLGEIAKQEQQDKSNQERYDHLDDLAIKTTDPRTVMLGIPTSTENLTTLPSEQRILEEMQPTFNAEEANFWANKSEVEIKDSYGYINNLVKQGEVTSLQGEHMKQQISNVREMMKGLEVIENPEAKAEAYDLSNELIQQERLLNLYQSSKVSPSQKIKQVEARIKEINSRLTEIGNNIEAPASPIEKAQNEFNRLLEEKRMIESPSFRNSNSKEYVEQMLRDINGKISAQEEKMINEFGGQFSGGGSNRVYVEEVGPSKSKTETEKGDRIKVGEQEVIEEVPENLERENPELLDAEQKSSRDQKIEEMQAEGEQARITQLKDYIKELKEKGGDEKRVQELEKELNDLESKQVEPLKTEKDADSEPEPMEVPSEEQAESVQETEEIQPDDATPGPSEVSAQPKADKTTPPKRYKDLRDSENTSGDPQLERVYGEIESEIAEKVEARDRRDRYVKDRSAMTTKQQEATDRRVNAETKEAALEYLMRSKWYENATDLQRDAAFKEVSYRFGAPKKRLNAQDRANQAVGNKGRQKFVDELQMLKDQFKIANKAGKDVRYIVDNIRKYVDRNFTSKKGGVKINWTTGDAKKLYKKLTDERAVLEKAYTNKNGDRIKKSIARLEEITKEIDQLIENKTRPTYVAWLKENTVVDNLTTESGSAQISVNKIKELRQYVDNLKKPFEEMTTTELEQTISDVQQIIKEGKDAKTLERSRKQKSQMENKGKIAKELYVEGEDFSQDVNTYEEAEAYLGSQKTDLKQPLKTLELDQEKTFKNEQGEEVSLEKGISDKRSKLRKLREEAENIEEEVIADEVVADEVVAEEPVSDEVIELEPIDPTEADFSSYDVKNAEENPALEPYINSEVESSRDMLGGPKAIQETAELGKKLDADNANVVFKRDLGIVGGRRIFEFEVEGTGEKFLMYKSKGEGTGPESKGKWVPLKYFAKDGWFVKGRVDNEGNLSMEPLTNENNPKFNKYGSETFKELAKKLEADAEAVKNENTTETKEEVATEEVAETKRTKEDVQKEIEATENEIEQLEEVLNELPTQAELDAARDRLINEARDSDAIDKIENAYEKASKRLRQEEASSSVTFDPRDGFVLVTTKDGKTYLVKSKSDLNKIDPEEFESGTGYVSKDVQISIQQQQAIQGEELKDKLKSEAEKAVKKIAKPFHGASIKTIKTLLERVGLGKPELKEATVDIYEDIVAARRNIQKLADELTTSLNEVKKENKITDKFLLKAKSKDGKSSTRNIIKHETPESSYEITNDTAVDLYMLKIAEGKYRLEQTGVDVAELDSYMDANPELKKYAEDMLDWYESTRPYFKDVFEDVTGRTFEDFNRNPDGEELRYMPIWAKGTSERPGSDLITSDNFTLGIKGGKDQNYSSSVMTDRFKQRNDRWVMSKDGRWERPEGPYQMTGANTKALDYIKEMTHTNEMWDVNQKIKGLINPQTEGKLIDMMGEENYRSLKSQLDEITGGENKYQTQVESVINKVNKAGVVYRLAFNTLNIAKQATTATHWLGAGIKDGVYPWDMVAQSGLSVTDLVGKNGKEKVNFIWDIITDPQIKNRWKKTAIDPAFEEFINKASTTKEWSVTQKRRMLGKLLTDIGMKPTQVGDMLGVLGGGIPYALAYRTKYIKDGYSKAQASEMALGKMTKLMNELQQSQEGYATTPLQRSLLGRTFVTQYKSSQIQAVNKQMQVIQEIRDSKNATTNEKAQMAYDFIYWSMFNAGFSAFATGYAADVLGLSDSDDKGEERTQHNFIEGMMSSQLQGMGMLGLVAEFGMNEFIGQDWKNNNPMIDFISDITGAVYEASTTGIGDMTEKVEKGDLLKSVIDLEIKNKIIEAAENDGWSTAIDMYDDYMFSTHGDKLEGEGEVSKLWAEKFEKERNALIKFSEKESFIKAITPNGLAKIFDAISGDAELLDLVIKRVQGYDEIKEKEKRRVDKLFELTKGKKYIEDEPKKQTEKANVLKYEDENSAY